MYVAIKYLRDTTLTVEDIAVAVGFSDGAGFRHAFHRWTQSFAAGIQKRMERIIRGAHAARKR